MTAKTVTNEAATTSSLEDLAVADAPAVTHDRAVTPVGAGRIRFKGHNAAAGYPFRIYDGQVQALVGDAWVEAVDSEAI